MKFDFESIKVWLKGVPLIWKAAGLIILLLIFVLALSNLFESCGGYWTRRDIEKDKEAVNKLKTEANEINAQAYNLQLQENAKREQANLEAANYANAQNATNNQQAITNQFRENANAARNANVNVNFDESNRQRCLLYPNDAGC